MTEFVALNKSKEWACYNECSQLFLKEDTLINLCGGYTYYLTKMYNTTKEYTGEGTSTQKIKLAGSVDEVEINYIFYTKPDLLVVEDQNGNILYQTVMESNGIEKRVLITTNGVEVLVLKIKSKVANSGWKLKVEY